MKKKCRVYKPQSMQQGGQYDNIMAQDSIQNFQRQKMFEEMSREIPVDSPALYLKDGKYIPVGTEFSQKRVSPMFIDPTSTNIEPTYKKGGEPTMTQDSQSDPVYTEKTNNFMNWLHKSSDKAKVKSMLEEDKAMLDAFAKNGVSIPGYQIGGSIDGSGFGTGDYGQMNPMNVDAYANAFNAGKSDIAGDISTLAGLIPAKDKKQNPMNGETYDANLDGSPIETIPTTFNKSQYGFDPNVFGSQPGGFGEGRVSPLMQQGGDVNYPDNGLEYMMDYDYESLQSPQMQERIAQDMGNDFIPLETNNPNYSDFNDLNPNMSGNKEIRMKAREARREDRGATSGSSNPYFTPQAVNAATNVLTAIGSMDEQAKLEERLRRKQSNVHENFATFGSDRGDYMSNVAGVGDYFRPDQHTRMGYNTKIAQFGGEYNQDDELELTEEQINDLIAQGYDLEYLD